MSEYVVYSLPGCGHCSAAKDALKAKGHSFIEVDIRDFGKEKLQEMMINAGSTVVLKTAPQVFDGEEYIGGYTELYRRLNA